MKMKSALFVAMAIASSFSNFAQAADFLARTCASVQPVNFEMKCSWPGKDVWTFFKSPHVRDDGTQLFCVKIESPQASDEYSAVAFQSKALREGFQGTQFRLETTKPWANDISLFVADHFTFAEADVGRWECSGEEGCWGQSWVSEKIRLNCSHP